MKIKTKQKMIIKSLIKQKMSRFDWIKSLSLDDMAKVLEVLSNCSCDVCAYKEPYDCMEKQEDCHEGIKKFLEQEMNEDIANRLVD